MACQENEWMRDCGAHLRRSGWGKFYNKSRYELHYSTVFVTTYTVVKSITLRIVFVLISNPRCESCMHHRDDYWIFSACDDRFDRLGGDFARPLDLFGGYILQIFLTDIFGEYFLADILC